MPLISLVGSERPDSFNASAVTLIERALKSLGTASERAEWANLALPLYSQVIELEQGLPEAAGDLRSRIKAADGLIIGCPEYNGFMPPLLLNALTWATRNPQGQPDLSPFRLKPCLICASSPGSLGGIRAAGHLATYLLGIGASVYPDFFLIPNAFTTLGGNDESEQRKLSGRAEVIASGFLAQTRLQPG